MRPNDNTKSPETVKISYDRKQLEDIIGFLLEAPKYAQKKIEILAYVDTIEEKINAISRYQSMENPQTFYPKISVLLSDIKNITNTIYEETKYCDQCLSNTLKKLILEWITPLEEALEEEKIPSEVILKTKRLYAQQSLVSRHIDLREGLIQHLNKIKKLLSVPGKPAPRCYISYAWPSEKRKEEEYWVQRFLYVLYDHLAAAGIRVIMDIRDNKPGDSIFNFMRQYHDGNYIILIGTQSLLEKHYAERAHAVQTELSIITSRFEQDQEQYGQSRIYPLLISGTIKTAYPEIFDKYHTVRDGRENDYLKMLKNLTDWIYALEPGTLLEKQYTVLWNIYCHSFSSLPNDSSDVEQEIAINYHKPQYIEDLKQNIGIQTNYEECGSYSSSSSAVTYMFDKETDAQGESSCSSISNEIETKGRDMHKPV